MPSVHFALGRCPAASFGVRGFGRRNPGVRVRDGPRSRGHGGIGDEGLCVRAFVDEKYWPKVAPLLAPEWPSGPASGFSIRPAAPAIRGHSAHAAPSGGDSGVLRRAPGGRAVHHGQHKHLIRPHAPVDGRGAEPAPRRQGGAHDGLGWTELETSHRTHPKLRLCRSLTRLCERLGIEKLRFHDMRHSVASKLTMAGESQRVVCRCWASRTLA